MSGFLRSTIVLGTIAIVATLITRSGRPVDVLGRVCGAAGSYALCGIDLQVEGLSACAPVRATC